MDITGAFEVEGIVRQRQDLENLMMSNPAMEKKVQGLIRKVLMQARRTIGKAAAEAMDSDPRQAYKAVKTAVYRQILGGNVSLYRKKRASAARSSYEPPRTLREGQRGGNRMKRSERTTDMMSYQGGDRWMVLQWLNNGTRERFSGSGRNGKTEAQYRAFVERTGGRGKRESIAARNWFGPRSTQELQSAAANIDKMIDEIIQGIMY